MEFAPGSACVNILRGRNDNLLLFIVICSALSLVLSFLDGSLLVALVQVKDDVRIEVLDLLLQVRDALDPIHTIQYVKNKTLGMR